MSGKKKNGAENKTTEKEKEINPIVVMGNMSFQLSDLMDEEKSGQIEADIQQWMDKKVKAMERNEKRKGTARKPYKKRK